MDRAALAMLLAPVVAALPALAGDTGGTEGGFLDLLAEESVTTAAKTAQKPLRVAATISIVTREDILMSGATSVPELLRLVPGLNVIAARSSDASVGIRKVPDRINESMIVLVDGRTVYLDLLGSVFFENLPISLAEIERIEVIRGPSSTLWGANASSGIINIITRKPSDMAGLSGSLRAGQPRALDGTVIQAGQHGDVGYSVAAGYGTEASWDEEGTTSYAVPRIHAKVEWDRGEGNVLALSAGYAGLDGLFLNDLAPIDRQGGLGHLMATYTDRGLTVRGFVNHASGSMRSPLFTGDSPLRSDTVVLDAFKTFALDWVDVTAGAEYRHLTAEAEFLGNDRQDQDLWSVYAEGIARAGDRVEATIGLRYDHHPLTEPQLSPRVAIVAEPWDGHVLRAGYATAFRNPALIAFYLDADIVAPYPIQLVPNLALEPEVNRTLEGGYRYLHGDRFSLDLTLWAGRSRDPVVFRTIGYDPANGLPNRFQFGNDHSTTKANGIEMLMRADLGAGFSGLLAHTHQDVEGETVHLPHEVTAAAVRYARPGGFHAQLEAERVGAYRMPLGEVDAYTTVTARAGTSILGGRLALEAYALNLLDEEHQEHPQGETSERRVGAIVTFRP